MAESDSKQKLDADAAKPVVVHIYGPYLDLEPYEDALALKKTAEANGQPYLLIPPPNAEGNPTISPESKDYNLEYIKTQFGKAFGEGGRYAGRDHVDIISTHGIYQFESHGHRHQLGDGNITDSKDLYQALLSINGRCLGVQDGACYAGAGLVGFNEALRATAGQHENPIPFVATSRFNHPTFSPDNREGLQQLKRRVDRGETITPESVKASYLMNMANVNAAVTKTFDPKHLDPEWAVHYDDLQTGLERFYKEFHDKLDAMPSSDKLSALFKEHVLTERSYQVIKDALRKKNWEGFKDALVSENAFGAAMAMADTHYSYANNAMLNKQRFMGGQTESMVGGLPAQTIFTDSQWQKGFITDPEKQKEAFRFAAYENPVAFLWYTAQLKDRFTPKEMFELLKIGAEQEPRNFLQTSHQLQKRVSDEQDRLKLLAIAARSAVELGETYEVFASAKKWKDAVTPQERVELLTKAAKASPEACKENVGDWQSLFSEQEKAEIIKAAGEKSTGTSKAPLSVLQAAAGTAMPDIVPHSITAVLTMYHNPQNIPDGKMALPGPGSIPLLSGNSKLIT